MLYDLIPAVIIVSGLIAVVAIAVRKFPALAAIDVGSIPREKQMEVKKMLIENRLLGKLRVSGKKMEDALRPAEIFLKKFFSRVRDRVKAVEDKYRDRHIELIKGKPEVAEQKIKSLFLRAEELSKAEKLPEAEKKFIEIVKLDPQNIAACRNLGYIYLRQKDFSHAREIFEYNLRLSLKQAEGEKADEGSRKQVMFSHLDLGLMRRSAEDFSGALENFLQAVEMEPKNPKNLDLLIETSIMVKDKNLAESALKQLKEVNPDNQKIEKFEEQIKALAS